MADAPTLTATDRAILKTLARNARDDMGLNAFEFGGKDAARRARRLAIQGLVELQRISRHHIRYAATAAGRLVVTRFTAESDAG